MKKELSLDKDQDYYDLRSAIIDSEDRVIKLKIVDKTLMNLLDKAYNLIDKIINEKE